ncbi:methionyl-tRNA formyltransferase [Marinilongibacter aquaticus]|uniref:methionyl-tRNA formyltransferase n=1 Tax=Marinilongibacter aquaticus TaxID=2975157 RepID=UPI0021BD0510|nr:methionyl-tRNA formyltransferase [Marinilongibacter aquaticus]UBM60915.1 methionyl-tRNA formyltransferase [Marinilongibacter aquaticus]
MRIIFMGTPEFAVASLKKLVDEGANIVAVVTAPDRPAGRGQQMRQTPVKIFAVENDIPVLQPEKLRSPDFLETLASYQADLQIVVAFRMLPEVVWSMPPLGTFNLHGSLLPQYRGAAPINWAIINGEKTTGVSTFFIEKEIDTGNILFTENIDIPKDMNAGELHDEMKEVGANLVWMTTQAIAQKSYTLKKQEELIDGALKPAPKIDKEVCKINWLETSEHIYNLIRGLSPYPAAWTCFRQKDKNKDLAVKIYACRMEKAVHQLPVGGIQSDQKTYMKIACNDGFIHVLSLQIPGKKQVQIDEFLRGYAIDNFEVVL